jgi:tRNA(Ile)-lysidine synthase
LSDLARAFDRAMAALLPDPPAALGLAVSGGGDSMALLHLANHWAAQRDCKLHVATVDHGLRPEAAQECTLVARHAAMIGAPHDILAWEWDHQGNLQASARQARHALLSDWAKGRGIGHICLGHTRDDQAETVLMRLQRGSGVDGLAGMAAQTQHDGLTWLRPLLGLHRAALRDHLRAVGWDWADDPSNDDTRFARVRARQTIEHLALDVDRLAETATHMAQARAVLDHVAAQAARTLVQQDHGDLVLDTAGLRALLPDTRDRLLSAALCWVGQNAYRPRLTALHAAMETPRATLHGCLMVQHGGKLRICREWNAVAQMVTPAPGQWDGRWQIDGPMADGLEIRALGAHGIAQTNRAAWLVPRESALASPSVWDGNRLLSAPLAGLDGEFRANCRALPADWPAYNRAH